MMLTSIPSMESSDEQDGKKKVQQPQQYPEWREECGLKTVYTVKDIIWYPFRIAKRAQSKQLMLSMLEQNLENGRFNCYEFLTMKGKQLMEIHLWFCSMTLFLGGLCYLIETNFSKLELPSQKAFVIFTALLILITNIGLLTSLAFSLVHKFTSASNALCYSLSLMVISGIQLAKHDSSNLMTLTLILITAEVLVSRIFQFAEILPRAVFVMSIMAANYLAGASVIDLVSQCVVIYTIQIETGQNRATIQAFYRIITSLKEDSTNNTNYVAGVVHDLRNPLTEIYSCAELLDQSLPESIMTKDLKQIVQAFKRNSENLISMVSNILDYAKIKSKKLDLDLQPVNVKEFIQKIVEMHQVKAKQKNLKLTSHIDEYLPEKLYIDQSRLTNILVNLTSNAIKFTNQGGVQIHVNWYPDSQGTSQTHQYEKEALEYETQQMPYRLGETVPKLTSHSSINQREEGKIDFQNLHLPHRNHLVQESSFGVGQLPPSGSQRIDFLGVDTVQRAFLSSLMMGSQREDMPSLMNSQQQPSSNQVNIDCGAPRIHQATQPLHRFGVHSQGTPLMSTNVPNQIQNIQPPSYNELELVLEEEATPSAVRTNLEDAKKSLGERKHIEQQRRSNEDFKVLEEELEGASPQEELMPVDSFANVKSEISIHEEDARIELIKEFFNPEFLGHDTASRKNVDEQRISSLANKTVHQKQLQSISGSSHNASTNQGILLIPSILPNQVVSQQINLDQVLRNKNRDTIQEEIKGDESIEFLGQVPQQVMSGWFPNGNSHNNTNQMLKKEVGRDMTISMAGSQISGGYNQHQSTVLQRSPAPYNDNNERSIKNISLLIAAGKQGDGVSRTEIGIGTGHSALVLSGGQEMGGNSSTKEQLQMLPYPMPMRFHKASTNTQGQLQIPIANSNPVQECNSNGQQQSVGVLTAGFGTVAGAASSGNFFIFNAPALSVVAPGNATPSLNSHSPSNQMPQMQAAQFGIEQTKRNSDGGLSAQQLISQTFAMPSQELNQNDLQSKQTNAFANLINSEMQRYGNAMQEKKPDQTIFSTPTREMLQNKYQRNNMMSGHYIMETPKLASEQVTAPRNNNMIMIENLEEVKQQEPQNLKPMSQLDLLGRSQQATTLNPPNIEKDFERQPLLQPLSLTRNFSKQGEGAAANASMSQAGAGLLAENTLSHPITVTSMHLNGNQQLPPRIDTTSSRTLTEHNTDVAHRRGGRTSPMRSTSVKMVRPPLYSKECSGTLVIQVMDTGIGIPAEFTKKLFQPFGQAHKGIQKTFGGTGLGLWISKMIVELMGGSIQLESEEGQGSRFTIKMKMKVAKSELNTLISSQENIKQAATIISQTQSTSIYGRKIVIFSDTFSFRLLKGYLEPLNFFVKHIIHPEALKQELKETGHNCIFFDEEYTDMVLKHVKNFDKQKQLILVQLKQQVPSQKGVSRHNLAGLTYMNSETQIDFIIRKPIQKKEFNEIFHKVLMRMHISLNQVSMSMNEIYYHQMPTDITPTMQGVIRATSAYINPNRKAYPPLSMQHGSERSVEYSFMSPDRQNQLSIHTGTVSAQNLLRRAQRDSNLGQSPPYSGVTYGQSLFRIAGGPQQLQAHPNSNHSIMTNNVPFQQQNSGPTTGTVDQLQLQPSNLQHHHSPQQQPQRSLPKLLVVDDQDFLQRFTVSLIEKLRQSAVLHFDILTAQDGEQAFQRFQQHSKDIKLILMDMQMPVMDGYESSQKIREYEETLSVDPKVHIVAVTGEVSEAHAKKCRLSGINESMSKPLSRVQLEQLLAIFK